MLHLKTCGSPWGKNGWLVNGFLFLEKSMPRCSENGILMLFLSRG
jgi:hypothetical protein